MARYDSQARQMIRYFVDSEKDREENKAIAFDRSRDSDECKRLRDLAVKLIERPI